MFLCDSTNCYFVHKYKNNFDNIKNNPFRPFIAANDTAWSGIPDRLFVVVERYDAFYVGMQAVFYRACGGSAFYYGACFGVVVVGYVYLYLYAPYAAGLRRHYFGYLERGSVYGEIVRACGYAHDSEHATAESRRYQIGGRERLPFAVVVGGGVGKYYRSRLKMFHLRAEIA